VIAAAGAAQALLVFQGVRGRRRVPGIPLTGDDVLPFR
jgi:hypothetical protein